MSTNGRTNGHFDADTFDVVTSMRNVADAVRHHLILVILTCVIMLGLMALYIQVWPPIFVAEATLMAEADYDHQRDQFYLGWDIFRKDEAKTELELITSGPVLEEVVKREKLTYDDVYHPFLSQVFYFWEKSFVGRNYRKIKKMILPEDDRDALSPEQFEYVRTVNDLAEGVEMTPVGESSVGRLTVKGPSRRVAQIANTLVHVYLSRRVQRHQDEARKSYTILTEQVDRAADQLNLLTSQRADFSRKHDLTFDFQKESLQVSRLSDLETAISNARIKIASEEASLREVEKQLESEPPTRTVSTVSELNVLRENIKLKRLELQTALIQIRDRYREDSPEVQEIKSDLADLDSLAAESSEKVEKATTESLNMVRQDLIAKRNALQSDLMGARAGLEVMQATAMRLRSRLAAVPVLQKELQDLDRQLGASADKYKQLLAKQGQAAVSLSTSEGTVQSVRIVEYAAVPANKWWPKSKYLYPAALLVGLIMGISLAVLRRHTSGRVARAHVAHGRGTVPLYGTIPVASGGGPLFVAPLKKIMTIPMSRSSKEEQP